MIATYMSVEVWRYFPTVGTAALSSLSDRSAQGTNELINRYCSRTAVCRSVVL
jgi:hypothetical protein